MSAAVYFVIGLVSTIFAIISFTGLEHGQHD